MMTKRFSVGFGLLAVAISALAADKDKKPVDVSKLPPAAKKEGLTFEKDIKTILEKSCVKCHSGEKPKSKYRMDTLQAVIKGAKAGTRPSCRAAAPKARWCITSPTWSK